MKKNEVLETGKKKTQKASLEIKKNKKWIGKRYEKIKPDLFLSTLQLNCRVPKAKTSSKQ